MARTGLIVGGKLAALCVGAMLCVPAMAQQTQQEAPAGDGGPMSENYVLERRDDTFVRINKTTGEMTVCTVRTGQLTCQVALEERDYYLDEIAKLDKRVKALEDRVETLETAPAETATAPASPDTAKPEAGTGGEAAKKPVQPQTAEDEKMEREFDRAMDYMTRAMRRFFDAVKELKNDMGNSIGNDTGSGKS